MRQTLVLEKYAEMTIKNRNNLPQWILYNKGK